MGVIDHHALLATLREEIMQTQREINNTPMWRKIRRYRLLEKLYDLEEGYGLIEHVFLEDQ